jgi:hypothetical protein
MKNSTDFPRIAAASLRLRLRDGVAACGGAARAGNGDADTSAPRKGQCPRSPRTRSATPGFLAAANSESKAGPDARINAVRAKNRASQALAANVAAGTDKR